MFVVLTADPINEGAFNLNSFCETANDVDAEIEKAKGAELMVCLVLSKVQVSAILNKEF